MIMSFDDGMVASSRAAPLLDPSLVYAINQGSTDPADAVDTSQAVQAFGHSVMFSQTFNDQDPWVQQKILDHLTPAQVGMLQGAGGKPKKHDGGILGDVLGAVGGALGTVEHAVSGAVGEGLNVLGMPLRAVQHLYRAGQYWGQHGEGTGTGANPIDPHGWAEAWNRTENGEQSFAPEQERALRKKYGDQQVDLAAKLVGGTKPEEVAKVLPDDQRIPFLEQLRDPEFQTLMKSLEASKMSFGRQIVGANFIVHSPQLPSWVPVLGHQTVGNLLSGGIDALNDGFTDPTLQATKATSALRTSKYLVASEGGAETVDRLLQTDKPTQRLMEDLSGHLQQDDVAGLIQKYPQFSTVAPDWASRGISSQEELGTWFRSQAEQGALFQGQGGGALPRAFKGQGYQGVMPHLSMTEQTLASAKQKITQAIDWASERPSAVETQRLISGAGIEEPLTVSQRLQRSVVEPVGNVARSLTTLAPESGPMDINDPRMLTNIQRYTRMGGMPTADGNRVINAFASAADEAGKRNIFKSTILGAMRGIGVDEGYMQNWADNFDRGIIGRSYSPGGIDKLQMGNDTISAGVLENQLSHIVELPSYRDMLANSNRVGFAKAAWGVSNSNAVSSFMDNVWKPITLLRLGFPLRAGGEEAVGQMLRTGVIDFIRGKFAASAVGDLGGPVRSSSLGFMVEHLPEDAQLRITTAADLAAERWGNTAGQALRGIKGAVAGEDLTQAAREVAQMYPQALPDEISAAHGIAGYMGTPETANEFTRNGEKMKLVYQPTGGFREYSPTDPGQVTAWKYSLDQLAKDRLGQEALKVAGLSRDEQVGQLADFLQSPTFEDSWNRATRSKILRDGSQVGVDATERQAAEDWAQTVLDHTRTLTHDADGNRLIDPQSLLDAGRGPDIRALQALGAAPPLVGGPEVLPVPQNAWRSFLDKGFDRIVGRPMNWIARQPIFLQNYANARADLEPLRAHFESLAAPADEAGALKVATQVDQHLQELASQRALAETIPYIHNPEVRSQFAVYTKNLMPFWFAQEQFIKRWASTFYHSPEAFRKAQLAMNGLRHSGVVHKDDNGNDVFTYPGVDLTADALSALTSVVSGHKVMIPQPLTFNGQVKFATPGTERLGVPSFGPLVSIPLTAMADRFPELEKAQEQILGSRGVGRGYLEQVVPTTASRLAQVFMANPDTDAQMASAQKQALQYFAAHGKIPDEAASPLDKEKFLDDLKWTARTIALLRTMYGFATPAAPEAQIDPDHITSEFRQLLGSGVPIADAVNELVKMHSVSGDQGAPAGMLEPGTINLGNRPHVKNADGTYSTVRSISIEDNGKEVLIPTVAADGSRVLSNDEAIQQYRQTGDHLGIFDNAAHADAYAERLHKDQASGYVPVDVTPYTVFQSKSVSGAPIPATADALDQFTSNREFYAAYPNAAAWLLPQKSNDPKFDLTAYRESLALGLRQKKAPDQMLNDIYYAMSASDFFDSLKAKNDLIKANSGPLSVQNRNQINQAWSDFQQRYFDMHPVFADKYQSNTGHIDRMQAIDELHAALADPRAPATTQSAPLLTLLANWDDLGDQMGQLQYRRSSFASNQRTDIKNAFASWADRYVNDHPELRGVYDRLFRPELP